jgi:hypothetical protein
VVLAASLILKIMGLNENIKLKMFSVHRTTFSKVRASMRLEYQ